ncbi:antibiotic biosynthesis monooxygenase family protein [Streptomyces marianii]|uniref:Antibiotic biosynthesis monooxygenase n=1 Tax=Streptomyces marianii TaxID=1817406 RepID=A0A5R9DXA1_9ACTN|nr:antibiotic biosynthesis monooxygenase family protein [Streptomyces marianii]TLQ42238.1 antibiotic biosynthesis monooxygenase [Streptomyces marianii]
MAIAHIDSSRPVVTLVNVLKVSPEHQKEVLALLAEATEGSIKHLPGFICANFHASLDGKSVVNYSQWETEEDFHAMMADPEIQTLLEEAAANVLEFHPRLYEVASSHARG